MDGGMPKEWLSHMGPPVQDSGVGLAGMRERLNELKGRLELEPAGPGTRLRAIVPRFAGLHLLTSDAYIVGREFPFAGVEQPSPSQGV